MGVLLERKSQVIFVTASSVEENGKAREVIVESRPSTPWCNSMDLRRSIRRLGNDLQARQKSGTLRICAWRLDPEDSGRVYGEGRRPEAKGYAICSWCFLGRGFLCFAAGGGRNF